MRSIYSKPGIVETYVDPKINSVVVYWDDLSDATVVKESCLAQAEEVKQGVKFIIIDTTKADTVVPVDVQEWFGQFLFPILKEHNLKAMITILSASALTRLSSRRWMKTGNPFGFDIYECESLDAAREIVKSYQSV